MKKHGLIIWGALVVSMALIAYIPVPAQPSSTPTRQGNWDKLGESSIEPTENGMSSLSASEGSPLKAIKIKVKKGGINLHRCEIWFTNGSKKAVDLRNDVPAGAESREIELQEQSGTVSKIVFWYDTRNYGKQKAEVELWGKI